jgi:hypothetical protein
MLGVSSGGVVTAPLFAINNTLQVKGFAHRLFIIIIIITFHSPGACTQGIWDDCVDATHAWSKLLHT